MKLYVARDDAKTNQILRRLDRLDSGHIECVVVGRVDGKSRGIGSTTYLKPDSLERGYDVVEFVPVKTLLEKYDVNVSRQLPDPLRQRVAAHGVSLKIDGKGSYYVPARLMDVKPSTLDTRAFEEGLETIKRSVAEIEPVPEWAQRLSSEVSDLKRLLESVAVALDVSAPAQANGIDSMFPDTDTFLGARG